MAIYTRTGDKGTTSLFGGKRVSKIDLRIEASGSIDELTTYLGYVELKVKSEKVKVLLKETQRDLYQIMGFVAGAKIPIDNIKTRPKQFEQIIDNYSSKLPKLNRFILPGGTEASALFHILRVICRKAERRAVAAFSKKLTTNESAILQYLNRLSDLFFIMARHFGKSKEIST